MFAKAIVLSDAFLDMPVSARNLYFTMGMLADDDGFINNTKSIMRQCGASMDDLNLLIAKKFVLVFDDGVLVIKHWRIHNYIQKDRYTPTKYVEHFMELTLDDKNAYTFTKTLVEEVTGKPIQKSAEKRLEAFRESDLPYSFMYKMRNAFIGEKCPICGVTMGVPIRRNEDIIPFITPMPTIQHNKPISKGGKHELSNISVICQKCNVSIRDKETGDLNNSLVVEKWNEICASSGMYTQVRKEIGKESIGKSKTKGFTPPSLEEVETYCRERNNGIDPQEFLDFYTSNGWMVGKNKMKDWKASVRTWERRRSPKREDPLPIYDDRNNPKVDEERLKELVNRR